MTPLLIHMRASLERVMVRARDGLTRPPADPPDPLSRRGRDGGFTGLTERGTRSAEQKRPRRP